jgi:hypothetical protein
MTISARRSPADVKALMTSANVTVTETMIDGETQL